MSRPPYHLRTTIRYDRKGHWRVDWERQIFTHTGEIVFALRRNGPGPQLGAIPVPVSTILEIPFPPCVEFALSSSSPSPSPPESPPPSELPVPARFTDHPMPRIGSPPPSVVPRPEFIPGQPSRPPHIIAPVPVRAPAPPPMPLYIDISSSSSSRSHHTTSSDDDDPSMSSTAVPTTQRD